MFDKRLYVSTGAFNGHDLGSIFREALDAGITRLELSSGVPYQPNLLELVHTYQGRLSFLLHNYFPPPENAFVLNLAAADPEILERSRAHCRAALDLSAKLDARFFSVHAGFAFHPQVSQLGGPFEGKPSEQHEEIYARFKESVLYLVKYSQSLGLRLLVENNVVAPFNAQKGKNELFLMAETHEMERLAEEINSPWFGYLIDFGHLKVSARTLGFERHRFLEALTPWVRALHVSDNDGTRDSNQPFDREGWFLPWLRRWPEALIILESNRLTQSELRQCLNAIQSAIDPTDG